MKSTTIRKKFKNKNDSIGYKPGCVLSQKEAM